MDLVSTRRVGLGVAGALIRPARDLSVTGYRVAAFGWRTPLAAPVRRPTRALIDAAGRRGAVDESLLLAEAATDLVARAPWRRCWTRPSAP